MKITMTVVRMPDIRRLSRQALAKVDEGLNQAAILATRLIKERTARGVGVEGAFKAYSDSYAKAKRKGWPKSKWRKAYGGTNNLTPNLVISGNMLGAMAIKQGKGYAEIYFRGATENKKAAMNNEIRPFFALNNDEMKEVSAKFKQYVGF